MCSLPIEVAKRQPRKRAQSVPTQPYKLPDGTKVPGTTTVISASLGWNKGALMYWSWQQGKDGKDFRESRQAAADAGTYAHALAEHDIKGGETPTPPSDADLRAKGEAAFEAYLDWKRSTRLYLVASEVALVATDFKYGGTIDAIGLIDGKLALIDFKTSNHTHPDYIIQVAAYAHLWEFFGQPVVNELGENLGTKLDGGIHILRFSKEGGDFHHHKYRRERIVGQPWDAFLSLRHLYDCKKSIEGMV